MQKLIEKHHQVIRDTPTEFSRSFGSSLYWDERLIGIKGAKGVGKTTLILQHIKRRLNNVKSIYISLDDPFFYGNTLTETVNEFIKIGYSNKIPLWLMGFLY